MESEQLQSLWESACALIQEEMTDVSYSTWIQPLAPFTQVGDMFFLCVETEFKRNMLRSRYATQVSDALTRVVGSPVTADFLLPLEAEEAFAEANNGPKATGGTDEVGSTMLNPKYTFSTFVIGNSNRFAHAASLAVAEAPAQAYNPLFIYGGVGLGKTHLMHAISHYVLQQNPAAKVAYISSENFTNEMIDAIKSNKNVEFRNRFRSVDLLLIDDIQFIAGRDSTQEEFFHTFNTLHESGKQIILSSDKQPKEIPKLEERLRSRFEWGLIADIQRPDMETRVAILRRKAELENLSIPDNVHTFIAEQVESNIRELEGSLTRVIAFASLVGRTPDLEIATEALRDILTIRDPKRITCAQIMTAVAEYYSLSIEDLKGKKRNREITIPRQVAMALTREFTDLSLPKIGDEFGGRDHSTVIHACAKVVDMAKESSDTRTVMDDLRKRIIGK